MEDHGNGTATIRATMPGFSVWVLDDKHQEINDEISVINYSLVIKETKKEALSLKTNVLEVIRA